jgi:DNA-binding MarR family transcriptional regulator
MDGSPQPISGPPASSERSAAPAASPGPGSAPAASLGAGSASAASPGPGSAPAASPGPGSAPAAALGAGSAPAVPSAPPPSRGPCSAPAAPPRSDFVAAFDALAQAVRRARGAGGRAGDAALTLSQYGLLEGLGGRRTARVQDLADSAGIAPSTATRILDALERRGVVRRVRSPEDRRAVAVSLTAVGERLLRTHDAWMREREAAFYESLPAVEQELAPDLLLRLAALIDELAAGPDRGR